MTVSWRELTRLTGAGAKTTLVRLGLAALTASESAKRLAQLGGTEKQLNRHGVLLWTGDHRHRSAADRLGVGFSARLPGARSNRHGKNA